MQYIPPKHHYTVSNPRRQYSSLQCLCLQLIAATTLYLAGKVKDDPLKIRDVINVTHNTLHRGSVPLELGDEYWNMRDAIVQAELLIMRMLKFEVTVIHPHRVSGLFHCKNREKMDSC